MAVIYLLLFMVFSIVEGEDFSVVSPLVVEFPPTADNGTQRCINISVTSDNTLEGPQSFLVNLTQVSLDIVTLDPSSVTIDVVDGNCKCL